MRSPSFTRALLALACMFCIVFPASGATITAGAGGMYGSIQEAVDHAAAGSVVLVSSGTYAETVRIPQGIILQGKDTGTGFPAIDAQGRGNGISVEGTGVTIVGFSISNAGTHAGIRITGDQAIIQECTISGSQEGVLIEGSQGAQLINTTLSRNVRGVAVLDATGTVITRNTISDNTQVGAYIGIGSTGTQVFLNSFQNAENAEPLGATTWISPGVVSYTYNGRAFSEALGNYWSGYNGKDSDGNGIGDSPYTIGRGGSGGDKGAVPGLRRDRAPLVLPWKSYFATTLPLPYGTTPAVTKTGTVSPTPSETTPAPVVTPVTPGPQGYPFASMATISAMVLLIYMAILGLAAVALYAVVRRDTRRPIQGTRAVSWHFLGLHAGLGLLFLAVPVLLLNYLVLLPGGGSRAFGVFLCFPLLYLALSSGMLLYAGHTRIMYPTVHRVHIPLAAILGGILVLSMPFLPQRGDVIFIVTAAATAVSAVLAYRQGKQSPGPGPTLASPTVLAPAPAVPSSPGDVPVEQTARFFPPELQGKYTDIEVIGKGGVARVFKARRRTDGMMVAVKLPISYDEITGLSFMREIQSWQELRHPNIVTLYDANILPVPYFEMEYLPRTLEEVTTPLPLAQAVAIIIGIARGLSYAHSRGIIHRDLKPHNILLTEDGQPKIADWGLSKALDESRLSSLSGFSLLYAAPEQVSPKNYGKTSSQTDIYQLGVIFYGLVTGTPPFGGDGIAEVTNHILHDEPVPPSVLDPSLASVEPVILRCLRKDPAARYQSVDEILHELSGSGSANEPKNPVLPEI